jgi:minichromosome maintenance protein 10
VQDLLYGRFHLRPPQIYNTVRLSRDGATYDVPVDGDWVTIAVVAERGDIRVSGMREAVSDEEDDEDDKNTSKSNPTDKEKSKDPKSKLASAKNRKQGGKSGGHGGAKKRRPRKYINLKLVALPPRNKTLGGGMTTSGDALLQLLLFESDAIVHTGDGNGGKTRSYRGGSGGAYERWCNLGVGSVIAVLNPRVLRPLKAGYISCSELTSQAGGAPHPLTLPLALNPQSDDSIQLIGHAMDIGRCTALQRDGNRCTTWVDTRLNSVCEYHVHAAVKRGRASRAEFASATTSFELESRTRAAAPSRFGAGPNSNREGDYSYNPQLRRGLLPASASRAAPRGSENGGGGATYVVGSGIARTDGGFGDAHLAERLGRSQAEKRKRKLEAAEAEAAMNKILERRDDTSVGAKYLAAAGKGPVKKGEQAERKRVFNAMAIRRIGFDPSGVRDEDADKRVSARVGVVLTRF